MDRWNKVRSDVTTLYMSKPKPRSGHNDPSDNETAAVEELSVEDLAAPTSSPSTGSTVNGESTDGDDASDASYSPDSTDKERWDPPLEKHQEMNVILLYALHMLWCLAR